MNRIKQNESEKIEKIFLQYSDSIKKLVIQFKSGVGTSKSTLTSN